MYGIYDKGTHTRLSDIPTDYFGYNSEGPLSKHSTVQRYPEEPTKDVFILAYQDNDAKNTLVNNAYDKLSSETMYYLLDTTICDDGFHSKDERIAQAINLLDKGLDYDILDQAIKSAYHKPSAKQWYDIPNYYNDKDVYINKDGLDHTPEIVDANQPITNDDLIKIVENGKPIVGGLNTIYAVANYDTPDGRGILENDIHALNDRNEFQNNHEAEDIYLYQASDKINWFRIEHGNDANFRHGVTYAKIVDNGNPIDESVLDLDELSQLKPLADIYERSALKPSVKSQFGNTSIASSTASELLSKYATPVDPYKGKDVFVVQYGKNDDKLFVTSMNSNENNFSKLQSHTETWANAKLAQLATNGVFVSDEAKNFVTQSGIDRQGRLSSDKLQEFTDLNIPQISNAQDFIDGLSELSTNDMTL